MAYKHKLQAIAQHTAVLQERTATALQERNRTTMLNDALQRHHTAQSNAQSINNARQVARAARKHSRLANHGAIPIPGESPHPYYINVDVTDVDSGEHQAFHFDYRNSSRTWIYDKTTSVYLPRHIETINLTE